MYTTLPVHYAREKLGASVVFESKSCITMCSEEVCGQIKKISSNYCGKYVITSLPNPTPIPRRILPMMSIEMF